CPSVRASIRRHPPRYRLQWSPGRFLRSARLNLTGSTPRASSASLAVLAAWHGSLHSHWRLAISVFPPCESGTMWSHSPSSVTRPQAWQVYWSLRLTASTSLRHGLPPLPCPQRLGLSVTHGSHATSRQPPPPCTRDRLNSCAMHSNPSHRHSPPSLFGSSRNLTTTRISPTSGPEGLDLSDQRKARPLPKRLAGIVGCAHHALRHTIGRYPD